MLVLKCSACKRKLFKYEKIGQGELLKCYRKRITKVYSLQKKDDLIFCFCGQKIGTDKGSFYKMIQNTFTYSGTKTK